MTSDRRNTVGEGPEGNTGTIIPGSDNQVYVRDYSSTLTEVHDNAAGASSSDFKGVRPRLVDLFGLTFTQEEVDFAIPHVEEDLRFGLDPFLLWKSDRQEYRELHKQLIAFLALVRDEALDGRRNRAIEHLVRGSEARELGLGYSKGHKAGSGIGAGLANDILDAMVAIPQLREGDIGHLEVLGLVVPRIAEDRLSDLTAAVLKRYLVSFTVERAQQLDIPMRQFVLDDAWDAERQLWRAIRPKLPYNPVDGSPILLPPLDLLRHLPWINYEDYYKSVYARLVLGPDRRRRVPKETVLSYNRQQYTTVERYITEKEQTADSCAPTPLFRPLQITTLRRKLQELQSLPTGRTDGVDRRYETLVSDLLESLLYPELEFADSQVRTLDGVHIRDLIFYNAGKTEFLDDFRQRYEARQLVFELKNVRSLESGHTNQLHRYLGGEFGRVGILTTRNPVPRAVQRNLVDLHSSKRAIILVLSDGDLSLMVDLLEAQLRPVEAVKRRYIEFTRLLPS